MINFPLTIQVHLPSGNPLGLRLAEVTNRLPRVIDVPRKLLGDFFVMSESKQTALYFLMKDEQQAESAIVYVGQTGNAAKRLAEHDCSKSGVKKLWNRALVVVSQTNNWTPMHAQYLEWWSIQRATEAGRCQVGNKKGGSKPNTPSPLEADCRGYFADISVLLASLGSPIFQPYAKPEGQLSKDDIVYLKSGKYAAVGQHTEEGLVVLKGSKAKLDVSPGMVVSSLAKLRASLILDGTLKLLDGHYIFQKDFGFKSPSAASGVVTGASTDGWVVWKTESGKTLHELKRKPQ
jgi:Domain of unknown function (DUF4357)